MKQPLSVQTAPNGRRLALIQLGGLAVVGTAILAVSPRAHSTPASPLLEVWKDPNCGCCKDWVALMTEAGFEVKTHDTGNRAKRQELGLSESLGSCHTATVGGYVVEGHVPADAIQRLLRERPRALGLTVPGVPIGSPGMDGPAYGGRKDVFNVLLVLADGRTRVWQAG